MTYYSCVILWYREDTRNQYKLLYSIVDIDDAIAISSDDLSISSAM